LVSATPAILFSGDVRERSRRARPASVAGGALLLELAGRLASPPILAFSPVDDHRDVRIVLVVLNHLVVELVGELGRDHAVDHPAPKCRDGARGRHPYRCDYGAIWTCAW